MECILYFQFVPKLFSLTGIKLLYYVASNLSIVLSNYLLYNSIENSSKKIRKTYRGIH